MKTLLFAILLSCPSAFGSDDGWINMFNGKSLDGWKADAHPEAWSVRDGAITGDGQKSNLFWMVQECENCEFKADIKINDGGNSGMFFRKGFGLHSAKGYEAQINSTHVDPKKTGSLYNYQNIYDQLVPPEVWFNQHVIANGNHIMIRVNDKTVVDFVDEKNTFTQGYLAIQQHHQGSVVMVKNIMMKPLPDSR